MSDSLLGIAITIIGLFGASASLGWARPFEEYFTDEFLAHMSPG